MVCDPCGSFVRFSILCLVYSFLKQSLGKADLSNYLLNCVDVCIDIVDLVAFNYLRFGDKIFVLEGKDDNVA
jgi:hypothetical protein